MKELPLKLRWIFLVISLVGFLFGGLGYAVSVQAHSTSEGTYMQVPIYTPTAQPDGRIIYIVKEGDTITSIALINGIDEEDLRGMNNLVGDIITVGQELLLGFGGPPEEIITPGPTPTSTIALPTPTPQAGFGNLCILLFNDLNGDSLRQEEEASIPGGAISIKNRVGTVSDSIETGSGLEAHCFEELPEGLFTISVAIPPGYNPTTNTSFEIELGPGDITYIDFGAQASSETVTQAPIIPEEGQKSPVLGIIGGVILLLGAGLALFAGRLMKGR